MKTPIKVTMETEVSVKAAQKAKGLYLVEVQDHFEDNKKQRTLVFDTKPQADTVPTLEARIAELERRVGILTK